MNKTSSGSTSSKKVLIGGIAVVCLLLIIGGIIFAVNSNKKPQNTMQTRNGKTYVSNANQDNAAVKGVVLEASLKAGGYKQLSAQVSDSGALKKQVSDEGSADLLTLNGSTAYGTTQQQGGDAVIISWGTTKSGYDAKSFDNNYNSYAAKTYAKSSLSVKTSALKSITVKTTAGKTYELPCTLSTISGSGFLEYSIACQGKLGTSNAFISYSTISGNKPEAQSAMTKFVAGSEIEV